MGQRKVTMPVGVVVRRQPGVTRWAKWVWRPVAVLPGAAPAAWRELRRDGEAVEYHAATVPLELFRTDAEAYLVSLSMTPPRVFVVLRKAEGGAADFPYRVHAVTASAYEAQDYQDSGDEIVEAVAMPPGLVAWVEDFARRHFADEAFVKRRRDEIAVDGREDGIGDPRVRQNADVYRAPGTLKP
jgi:Protein of unknown function (DUF3305)